MSMEQTVVETQHVPFPKIPRLNRDIVITEKIDGTNAAIRIGENVMALATGEPREIPELGPVVAQSRTRIITPEKDNYGFARWVKEHEDVLREALGPGIHYGEWWGLGIQRGYKQTQKWFSLFNYKRWANDPRIMALSTIGVQVVPILYRGPWMAIVGKDVTYFEGMPEEQVHQIVYGTREQPGIIRFAPDMILARLAKIGSYAAMVNGVSYKRTVEDGRVIDKGPEGIVVYHEAGRLLFKATIENDGIPKGDVA